MTKPWNRDRKRARGTLPRTHGFPEFFFFLYSLCVPRSPLKKSPVFTGNINGPSWRVKDARLLLLSHCEVILFLPMTMLTDSTIFRYSSV